MFDAKERTENRTFGHGNGRRYAHEAQRKILPDLWFYEDEAGNPDFYTWCNAYLYALDIVPTDWFEAVEQEEFEDLFYPIMALGGIYDDEENGEVILHLNEKELTQLESDLPHVLLDIYWYWQAIINKPQTVRREGEKKWGVTILARVAAVKKVQSLLRQIINEVKGRLNTVEIQTAYLYLEE